MAKGDVNIGISTSYDGKDAKASAKDVEAIGKAAEQAAPKLKKYSNEIKSAGVSSQELFGGRSPEKGGGLGNFFGGIVSRITVAGAAILGFRKLIQALGQGPEIAALKQSMGQAAAAFGTVVARSAPFRSSIRFLTTTFQDFADSVNQTKQTLPDLAVNLAKGQQAAEGFAAAAHALASGINATATAFDEANQKAEDHLKDIEEQINAEKELALAKAGTIVDPEARAKAQAGIEESFTARVVGARKGGKAAIAKSMREQAAFIEAGGHQGFEPLEPEEQAVAFGKGVQEARQRLNEARQRFTLVSKSIIANESEVARGENDKKAARGLGYLVLPAGGKLTDAVIDSRIHAARTAADVGRLLLPAHENELRDATASLANLTRFADPRIVDEPSARQVWAERASMDSTLREGASQQAARLRAQADRLDAQNNRENLTARMHAQAMHPEALVAEDARMARGVKFLSAQANQDAGNARWFGQAANAQVNASSLELARIFADLAKAIKEADLPSFFKGVKNMRQ